MQSRYSILRKSLYQCSPITLKRNISIGIHDTHRQSPLSIPFPCNCIRCMSSNRPILHPLRKPISSRSLSVNPDDNINEILANNRKWVADQNAEDPTYFTTLAAIDKPSIVYFGCSDSRVPANEMFGRLSGEIFIHRNLGNQVPVTDLNALSVLEYAVDHLDVKDIIVTGHYDCVTVRAAMMQQDLGMLESWFRCVRDVYRLHANFLDNIDDDETRHRRLVELNVVEQCMNVFKSGIVQRKRMLTAKSGSSVYPRVHPLVFEPKTGIVHRIPLDYTQKQKVSYDRIYNLYEGHVSTN
jgi:carbonic anhydrase